MTSLYEGSTLIIISNLQRVSKEHFNVFLIKLILIYINFIHTKSQKSLIIVSILSKYITNLT